MLTLAIIALIVIVIYWAIFNISKYIEDRKTLKDMLNSHRKAYHEHNKDRKK